MAPVVCLLWEESTWGFFILFCFSFCGNFPLAPFHCSQDGRCAICKAPSKLFMMKHKLQTSDQGGISPARSAGNDGSCGERGRKAQWIAAQPTRARGLELWAQFRPQRLSMQPFGDPIVWIPLLCSLERELYPACDGAPMDNQLPRLKWLIRGTSPDFQTQPVLTAFRRSFSNLTALAGAGLPENKAHRAGELPAASLAEWPPSMESGGCTARPERDPLPLPGAGLGSPRACASLSAHRPAPLRGALCNRPEPNSGSISQRVLPRRTAWGSRGL